MTAELLADLAAAHRAINNRARPCDICEALEKMPDEVSSTVSSYIDGKLVGQKRLAAILTQHGFPTNGHAVARHQKGHPS